jgi:ADP-ribose pyrophosphatase YjhB (NUDIX family)
MPPRIRGDRAAVLIVRNGKLLLLHREKRGEAYDALPGGTVEPGETPEAAAVREVLEETGLRVEIGGRVLVLTNQGREESYFEAASVTGEARLGGEEAARNRPGNRYELAWVPLRDVAGRRLLPPALARWLAESGWLARVTPPGPGP